MGLFYFEYIDQEITDDHGAAKERLISSEEIKYIRPVRPNELVHGRPNADVHSVLDTRHGQYYLRETVREIMARVPGIVPLTERTSSRVPTATLG